MNSRGATILILALSGAAAAAAERQVEVLETRPGIRTEVLFMTQPGATANVVLFAGGTGVVTFHANGEPNAYAGNFLVRTRDLFFKNGFNVAIPGAPSDRVGLPEGLFFFRRSAEHATDLAAIMTAFRKRANLPVWVVGTSMGTYSALTAVLGVKEGAADGVVFNASIVTHPRALQYDERLGQIRVPVLIQHHEQDECHLTLYKDLQSLANRITNSPRKRVLTYREGGPSRGDPCEAYGYHGFPGLENKVVDDIVQFINVR